jgi:hypothetical protein
MEVLLKPTKRSEDKKPDGINIKTILYDVRNFFCSKEIYKPHPDVLPDVPWSSPWN